MFTFGFDLGILIGVTLGFLLGCEPRSRRWILWNVRCRRGRGCAHVDFTDTNAPPGMTMTVGYECLHCGTVYEVSAIAGTDGVPIQAERERVG